MKILFMGTPDFARDILDELYQNYEIVGVVTQPDKPRGRGHTLTPSPVKAYALEKELKVFTPETFKDEAFLPILKDLDPELIVVAAYGKILPSYVLDYPKCGCINTHASLLPKYRGAAPIQRSIMDGEKETGVTIMKMEKGLDTGDMMLKEVVTIEDDDNFENVYNKLTDASRKAIREAAERIIAGTDKYEKQDGSLATYAEKIEKDDCIINFNRDAEKIHDQIRGLSPFPLAFTHFDKKLLKVVASVLVDKDTVSDTEKCATVVSLDNGIITVACKKGKIGFTQIVPEGKKKMNTADFLRGSKLKVGDKLGL